MSKNKLRVTVRNYVSCIAVEVIDLIFLYSTFSSQLVYLCTPKMLYRLNVAQDSMDFLRNNSQTELCFNSYDVPNLGVNVLTIIFVT